MADTPEPFIFAWVNSPRLRAVELFLWRNPKIAWIVLGLGFLFVTVPTIGGAIWYSFSNNPPVPAILKKMAFLAEGPHFSLSWISIAIGIAMFFAMLYLFLSGRRIARNELAASGGLQLEATGTVTKPCPYQWTHDMADGQIGRIADLVKVVRIGVLKADLEAALPIITWGFMVQNNSLFPISLDGNIGGYLYFEGHKLIQERLLEKNEIHKLGHQQKGQVIFEQRLSTTEVDLIKKIPEGKFSFQNLDIRIKGSEGFDRVKSQQVSIPNNFRGKLREIVDETSVALEPVETERDSLKAQVFELSALSDEFEITEAWYGIEGVQENDVKDALSKLIVNNGLKLDRRYNDIFVGQKDPARGTTKQLRIKYRHGDQNFSISVPENTNITLPVPYRKWG